MNRGRRSSETSWESSAGWLFNNGVIAGYFNETETDEVAWDGNSYSGANTTTLNFYPVPPATTPTVIVLTGTATAKRIAP